MNSPSAKALMIKTWTNADSDCFWPRDLLAPALKDCRIMTFGYNANVLQDTSKGRVTNYAENLLADLSGERTSSGVCGSHWPLNTN